MRTIPPIYSIDVNDADLDTMWYTLNNGTTNITISEFDGVIGEVEWNNQPNGHITIIFYANDTLGNIGYSEILINKDITAPTITIQSPTGDDVFGISSPDFVLEIIELYLDTMWYSIDGGITNITFTENGTISQFAWNVLSEGNIIIRFYSNDSVGNIGFVQVIIKKDVTSPIITINNPQNYDVIGATAPSFVISINEPNLDTVWYSLNGGTNITFTGLTGTVNQALWDALLEGNVVVKFYANDTLGRIGFQEVTVVKKITQPSPPGISGYNLLFLLGIISAVAIIIIKKRLNHLK